MSAPGALSATEWIGVMQWRGNVARLDWDWVQIMTRDVSCLSTTMNSGSGYSRSGTTEYL